MIILSQAEEEVERDGVGDDGWRGGADQKVSSYHHQTDHHHHHNHHHVHHRHKLKLHDNYQVG